LGFLSNQEKSISGILLASINKISQTIRKTNTNKSKIIAVMLNILKNYLLKAFSMVPPIKKSVKNTQNIKKGRELGVLRPHSPHNIL